MKYTSWHGKRTHAATARVNITCSHLWHFDASKLDMVICTIHMTVGPFSSLSEVVRELHAQFSSCFLDFAVTLYYQA
jgi:hypothetical protein